MKGNRGITLVILIGTIILMLIITGITITVSMDSVNHSRVVKFVAYMQIIQGKVDEIRSTNQDYTMLGKSLAESGKSNIITSVLNTAKSGGEIKTSAADSSYRYFDKQELSSDLGIDNIEDEIVINFETREVISLNGVKYESKIYYTQYLLPTGQSIITGTEAEKRDLDFNITKSINGLEATITISNISIANGTLKYKEGNENWIVVSNYTNLDKDETITVSKSGTYTFMLVDNTSSENYYTSNPVNIVLTNPPVLTEGLTCVKEEYDYAGGINRESGAVATDGTYEYIWVPRYAYKETSTGFRTIKFMKGTSSTITTYNEAIKGEEWIIASNFSNNTGNGYLESTGLWLREEQIDIEYGNILEELQIGDYVNYIPTSTYTSTSPYTVDGNVSGSGTTQGFYTEEFKWKILSIDTENQIVKLVAETQTSSKITLSGANGYNNGVDILNNICEALYSNRTIESEARSINIDDVAELGKIRGDYYTISLSGGLVHYVPSLFIAEKAGEYSPSMKVGNYTTYNGSIRFTENKITTFFGMYYPEEEDDYNGPQGLLSTGGNYLLATRSAWSHSLHLQPEIIIFGIKAIREGYLSHGIVFSSTNTYGSDYEDREIEYSLRPVIELNSGISFSMVITNSTDSVTYWNIDQLLT